MTANLKVDAEVLKRTNAEVLNTLNRQNETCALARF